MKYCSLSVAPHDSCLFVYVKVLSVVTYQFCDKILDICGRNISLYTAFMIYIIYHIYLTVNFNFNVN